MPVGKLGRDLGPCLVYWGTDVATAVSAGKVGATLGDVTVNYKEVSKDVKEDGEGVSRVDAIVMGHDPVTVDVPFSRLTMAQFAALDQCGTASGGESGRVRVKNDNIGDSMYTNSKFLVLAPIVAGVVTTDDSEYIVFMHAYPEADAKIVFNTEGQRVFQIHFHCFPDAATKEVWRAGN